MPVNVLFAGDANLDLILTGLETAVQEDREVFCKGYSQALGGSSTIASSAYARLGGCCDFCGLLGDDEKGALVAEILAQAGVGLGLLRRRADLRTGVTVNLVREGMRTQITYPGCLLEVDETETLLRELPRYRHLHLSGLYGTRRFLPHVKEVLAAARAAGLSTSLDLQWDPTEEWRHTEEWLPHLSWLFANEAEAASLALRRHGRAGTGYEAAWKELRALTACPIVKLGAQGAYADGMLYPPYPVEEMVDPTGAGDSFAAGFLYAAVDLGRNFERSMHYALASGAVACTFEGGSSMRFSLAAVEDLLRR